MAEWKKNPLVGVVAGVIILITIIIIISSAVQRARAGKGPEIPKEKQVQDPKVKIFTAPPAR